ncbi:hypothetical protein AVEN_149080-1, partial [Araneus ventricosus]|uniref:Adenosine deaminase domain-containing protein n=1 Tax=Araneus ventricosus TaxID=182803 RepID=A0A4Y2VEF5_ARAVE
MRVQAYSSHDRSSSAVPPAFLEKFDKVELHIHLDGSVRPETIWEISQRKGIHLASSSADYRSSLVTKEPSNLANFLAPIATYLPVIA